MSENDKRRERASGEQNRDSPAEQRDRNPLAQERERERPVQPHQSQAPHAQTRQPAEREPSLATRLQRPASMAWLKFKLALFLSIGLGYAITFVLANAFTPKALTGGSYIDAAFAFFVGLFLATLIAAIACVKIGSQFDGRTNDALVNAFVGAALGFVVIAFLLFVLVLSQAPGGGVDFVELVGPLIGYLVGVGITGAVTVYVTRWATTSTATDRL